MAYIGTKPTIGNFQICDAISVVNGQAAYTMQVGSVNVIPQSSNHMIVSLNGTIQKPGGANPSFTVSGSTITFASNLATGDVIDFIQILGDVLDLGVPSDGTVTNAKINYPLAKSGATVSTLNRTTNDGSILEVQRQGTTVGSLETVGVSTSGRLVVKSTTFDGYLDRAGTTIAKWMAGSFTGGSDNSFDLGRGTERWNDLFLGGGVYLGGTGSANHLDDYEEGTFTPALLNAPSATFNQQVGKYIKIGNLVQVHINLSISNLNGGSGTTTITGLPFTAGNTPSSSMYSGTVLGDDAWSTNLSGTNLISYIQGGYQPNYVIVRSGSGSNLATVNLTDIGTSRLQLSICYSTI